VAGDAVFGGLLRFTFPPGEQSFVQLVGKPGLTCFVMLDRSQHRFLSVKFWHGRKARAKGELGRLLRQQHSPGFGHAAGV